MACAYNARWLTHVVCGEYSQHSFEVETVERHRRLAFVL